MRQSCRSPSFNIHVNELMDGNSPKPYGEVKTMLHADLARQWAAYVVGCLHVLMHEKDVRVSDSIAILIDSAVPEGSGCPHLFMLEVQYLMKVYFSHAQLHVL
jgi:galactokinase